MEMTLPEIMYLKYLPHRPFPLALHHTIWKSLFAKYRIKKFVSWPWKQEICFELYRYILFRKTVFLSYLFCKCNLSRIASRIITISWLTLGIFGSKWLFPDLNFTLIDVGESFWPYTMMMIEYDDERILNFFKCGVF